MSLKTSFDKIERSIGLFDIALSYSGDAAAPASRIDAMSRFQGLRFYNYVNYVGDQFGYDIFEIMRFVYSHCEVSVLLNSANYRQTLPTQFEFSQIKRSTSLRAAYVVELGGPKFELRNADVYHIDSLSDDAILEIATYSIGLKAV